MSIVKPILFYDFETSALPLFDQPSEDPRQPHIVSCAAVLADPVGRTPMASFELVAYPDGWESEPATIEIHGIEAEYAQRCGVEEADIVTLLLQFWRLSSVRVGHVESFDARIMRIALKRFVDAGVADEWKAGAAECTAKMAKPIMKVGGSRNPKLIEAYEFFTGKKLEDAHSAMVDVLATMAVFWAIKDGLKEIGR